MQCDEFEDRLNAVLDERRRPEADAELRLHCEACGECRQLAAAYRCLLDGFYALAAPAAPRDLAPRDLAARVLTDLQPSHSQRRRSALASISLSKATLVTGALATAAALLVSVMPLFRSWAPVPSTASPAAAKLARSDRTAPRRVAALGTTEPLNINLLPMVPELLALRSGNADPYAGLAKETGQGLASVVLYVPGIGGSKGIVDASGRDDPAWAVQMSEGLKPITDSVAETVNLLLRAMPAAVSDSRS